ncbi:MAG: pentapeptide repeat-containing protein [Spirochaetales bacterium]|nr:pentapeptide repeat-containing protein [Spirochaetales bacterium]
MYSFTRCKEPSCPRYATHASGYCLEHDPAQDLRPTLSSSVLDSVSISDWRWDTKDLSGKRILGSLFGYSTFHSVSFARTTVLNSNFSFCLFEKCVFDESTIRYSIFSGSTFLGCTFRNSRITHTNFNGSVFSDCDASGSDLYYSSFAHAHLHDTKLEDCNVRKADFRHTLQENLSFRWSNYRERLR